MVWPARALQAVASVCERYARWEADGTWAKLREHVQVRDDAVGRVEWMAAVDSTVDRAHQHATP